MVERILIDLSILENRPFTGVERYAFEIARRLAENLNDFELVAALGKAALDEDDLPGLRLVRGRRLPRSLWRRTSLPALARRIGAKLLFAPVSHVPQPRGILVLRTLHDLGVPPRAPRPLDVPTIVPSQATLDILESLAGPLTAPCRVIPHGVDEDFRRLPRHPERPCRGLIVGRVRPRRHPEIVAEAASLLAHEVEGFELDWVGPDGENRKNSPGLVFHGFVERARLLEMMSRASFLLVPAEVEGFGLPVIEAMAAGLPVLARAQPVLAEVGSDLVVTYEGDDPAVLASRMKWMVTSSDVPAADDLRIWSSRFDWDLSAIAHARFIEEALA